MKKSLGGWKLSERCFIYHKNGCNLDVNEIITNRGKNEYNKKKR